MVLIKYECVKLQKLISISENGNIVLLELMQTLQKSPNKEKVIDSDVNESEEYVTEYSVIQYKIECLINKKFSE